MSRLDAVLFDMDGLLVDTEPQWFAAEGATVRELGGVWGKQEQHAPARHQSGVRRRLHDRPHRQRLTRETVMKMLFDNMTVQLASGLTSNQVRWSSWMSSSERMSASAWSRHLSATMWPWCWRRFPATRFEAVVTADDVPRLKPDPLPYLTALEQLGVRASHSWCSRTPHTACRRARRPVVMWWRCRALVPIEPAPGERVVSSLTELL